MERTHKVLSGFFWIAFAAFLAASIPHVAYFFRAYEPIATGMNDTLYWLISYGIAVSIDITIFLLSMTVAGMHRQNKPGQLIFSVWVFIIGLAALSWFINYKYATHFINMNMVSSTSLTLPWLPTIPDINPVIASMFQALAIAYTWISDKIASDEKPKSAAELKAEADELQNALAEKQRIATLKRGGKVSTLTGLFDAGKQVVNHVRNTGETQEENADMLEQDAYTFASQNVVLDAPGTQQRDTDKLVRITGQDATLKDEQSAETMERINQQDATKTEYANSSTGQKSVTIKEAALLLTKSESYVRTLLNNGKLRTTPRNKKRVLKSSIDAYLQAHKEPGKSPLKIVRDEQGDSEQSALSFVEQNMYDALTKNPGEMTELVRLSQEQDIDSFTSLLKARYSKYAVYITPTRVANVMRFTKQQVSQNEHTETDSIPDSLAEMDR